MSRKGTGNRDSGAASAAAPAAVSDVHQPAEHLMRGWGESKEDPRVLADSDEDAQGIGGESSSSDCEISGAVPTPQFSDELLRAMSLKELRHRAFMEEAKRADGGLANKAGRYLNWYQCESHPLTPDMICSLELKRRVDADSEVHNTLFSDEYYAHIQRLPKVESTKDFLIWFSRYQQIAAKEANELYNSEIIGTELRAFLVAEGHADDPNECIAGLIGVFTLPAERYMEKAKAADSGMTVFAATTFKLLVVYLYTMHTSKLEQALSKSDMVRRCRKVGDPLYVAAKQYADNLGIDKSVYSDYQFVYACAQWWLDDDLTLEVANLTGIDSDTLVGIGIRLHFFIRGRVYEEPRGALGTAKNGVDNVLGLKPYDAIETEGLSDEQKDGLRLVERRLASLSDDAVLGDDGSENVRIKNKLRNLEARKITLKTSNDFADLSYQEGLFLLTLICETDDVDDDLISLINAFLSHYDNFYLDDFGCLVRTLNARVKHASDLMKSRAEGIKSKLLDKIMLVDDIQQQYNVCLSYVRTIKASSQGPTAIYFDKQKEQNCCLTTLIKFHAYALTKGEQYTPQMKKDVQNELRGFLDAYNDLIELQLYQAFKNRIELDGVAFDDDVTDVSSIYNLTPDWFADGTRETQKIFQIQAILKKLKKKKPFTLDNYQECLWVIASIANIDTTQPRVLADLDDAVHTRWAGVNDYRKQMPKGVHAVDSAHWIRKNVPKKRERVPTAAVIEEYKACSKGVKRERSVDPVFKANARTKRVLITPKGDLESKADFDKLDNSVKEVLDETSFCFHEDCVEVTAQFCVTYAGDISAEYIPSVEKARKLFKKQAPKSQRIAAITVEDASEVNGDGELVMIKTARETLENPEGYPRKTEAQALINSATAMLCGKNINRDFNDLVYIISSQNHDASLARNAKRIQILLEQFQRMYAGEIIQDQYILLDMAQDAFINLEDVTRKQWSVKGEDEKLRVSLDEIVNEQIDEVKHLIETGKEKGKDAFVTKGQRRKIIHARLGQAALTDLERELPEVKCDSDNTDKCTDLGGEASAKVDAVRERVKRCAALNLKLTNIQKRTDTAARSQKAVKATLRKSSRRNYRVNEALRIARGDDPNTPTAAEYIKMAEWQILSTLKRELKLKKGMSRKDMLKLSFTDAIYNNGSKRRANLFAALEVLKAIDSSGADLTPERQVLAIKMLHDIAKKLPENKKWRWGAPYVESMDDITIAQHIGVDGITIAKADKLKAGILKLEPSHPLLACNASQLSWGRDNAAYIALRQAIIAIRNKRGGSNVANSETIACREKYRFNTLTQRYKALKKVAQLRGVQLCDASGKICLGTKDGLNSFKESDIINKLFSDDDFEVLLSDIEMALTALPKEPFHVEMKRRIEKIERKKAELKSRNIKITDTVTIEVSGTLWCKNKHKTASKISKWFKGRADKCTAEIIVQREALRRQVEEIEAILERVQEIETPDQDMMSDQENAPNPVQFSELISGEETALPLYAASHSGKSTDDLLEREFFETGISVTGLDSLMQDLNDLRESKTDGGECYRELVRRHDELDASKVEGKANLKKRLKKLRSKYFLSATPSSKKLKSILESCMANSILGGLGIKTCLSKFIWDVQGDDEERPKLFGDVGQSIAITTNDDGTYSAKLSYAFFIGEECPRDERKANCYITVERHFNAEGVEMPWHENAKVSLRFDPSIRRDLRLNLTNATQKYLCSVRAKHYDVLDEKLHNVILGLPDLVGKLNVAELKEGGENLLLQEVFTAELQQYQAIYDRLKGSSPVDRTLCVEMLNQTTVLQRVLGDIAPLLSVKAANDLNYATKSMRHIIQSLYFHQHGVELELGEEEKVDLSTDRLCDCACKLVESVKEKIPSIEKISRCSATSMDDGPGSFREAFGGFLNAIEPACTTDEFEKVIKPVCQHLFELGCSMNPAPTSAPGESKHEGRRSVHRQMSGTLMRAQTRSVSRGDIEVGRLRTMLSNRFSKHASVAIEGAKQELAQKVRDINENKKAKVLKSASTGVEKCLTQYSKLIKGFNITSAEIDNAVAKIEMIKNTVLEKEEESGKFRLKSSYFADGQKTPALDDKMGDANAIFMPLSRRQDVLNCFHDLFKFISTELERNPVAQQLHLDKVSAKYNQVFESETVAEVPVLKAQYLTGDGAEAKLSELIEELGVFKTKVISDIQGMPAASGAASDRAGSATVSRAPGSDNEEVFETKVDGMDVRVASAVQGLVRTDSLGSVRSATSSEDEGGSLRRGTGDVATSALVERAKQRVAIVSSRRGRDGGQVEEGDTLVPRPSATTVS